MFAGAVAFGDNPSEQRRILRGELTLGELFDEYLQRHLKKSRKAWQEYEKQFKRYFDEWLGRKLSTITQHDVERRHAEIARERVLTEPELDILQFRHQQNRFRPAPSKFVFPGTGETGHLTDIKRSWSTFCARARLNNLHIHDLRRSLASWMASTGANVSVIRSALNHKDVKTTLTVYARANQQSELAARQVAHKAILDLGKGESAKARTVKDAEF